MSTDDRDARFESFLGALAASPAPYRPPSLRPGSRFADRYVVERELGRGGMGTVYLALDESLGRKVALKVARGQAVEAELARLRQEATVMASLSHPGIVTVFEAGTDDEHVYLAMEFVPGGSLRDWLDAEPRDARAVLSMFAVIAEALAAAHAAGVVHRDFKPHNVLLDPGGRPRVADFGLARRQVDAPTLDLSTVSSSALTVSGSVLGTPAYMAPEQANGGAATPASDQFSFFVSLYEALAGMRPFSGATLASLLESIESGPPARVPGAPRAVAGLVRRGLAAQPHDRHRDMHVVAGALRRASTARRRLLSMIGVSAALVTAAGVGMLAGPSPEPPCNRADLAASVDAVWTDAQRASVAAVASAETLATLDEHRDDLLAARVRACESHRITQTLSETDRALHGACMARLEGRLAGLVDELHAAPDLPVEELLGPPVQCDDVDTLRRLYNRYDDTSLRASARDDATYREGVRLATVAALRSRRGEDTTEPLQALEVLAEAEGFDALLAHARLIRSTETLDLADKEALLEQAQTLANAGRDTQLSTEVAIMRADLALGQLRYDAALAFLDSAETLVRFHTDADARALDEVRITLLRQRVRVARGASAAVIPDLEALLPKLDATTPEAFAVRSLLAEALTDRGRMMEALAHYDALQDHPVLGDPSQWIGFTFNRAFTQLAAHRVAAARASFEAIPKALGGLEAMPPELRGYVELGRAGAARLSNELPAAASEAASAMASLRAADPEHPQLGAVLDELAAIAEVRGDDAAVVELGLDAIRRYDQANGPSSLESALVRIRVARGLHRLGRENEAISAATRAGQTLAQRGRPDDERAAAALALARAKGTPDPAAEATCRRSEQLLCVEALR